MGEERMQVLEMLAAGKITAEQADELLDALGDVASARQSEKTWTRQEYRVPRNGESVMIPTIEKLTEARMHGVSRQYAQEMREAGYSDLTLQDLMHLKMHGVNAKFVREMRDVGLGSLSPQQLGELRMHGVDADYIREMQDLVGAQRPAAEVPPAGEE